MAALTEESMPSPVAIESASWSTYCTAWLRQSDSRHRRCTSAERHRELSRLPPRRERPREGSPLTGCSDSAPGGS